MFAPPAEVDLSKVAKRGGDFAPEGAAAVMGNTSIIGGAVEHYRRLAHGVPAVAFAVNIEHSRAVAASFRAAGYRAAHLDGNTPAPERRNIIAALGRDLDVVSNVNIIAEGTDVPEIGAAILLRPTASLAMHLQMMGRALRPAPGKTHATIIDHAGNVGRLGFPDDPHAWSLDGVPKRARGEEKPIARRCEECGALQPRAAEACECCGHVLVRSATEVKEIAAELVEMERQTLAARLAAMPYSKALEWADTREKLQTVARARGYHHGWIDRQLASRGVHVPTRPWQRARSGPIAGGMRA